MPKVWVCYCVHHQKVVCFVPNLLTAVSSLLFFLVSGMGRTAVGIENAGDSNCNDDVNRINKRLFSVS